MGKILSAPQQLDASRDFGGRFRPLWSPVDRNRHSRRLFERNSGIPMFSFARVLTLAFLALFVSSQMAWAQVNRVADIANYQGADRERRLLEGAKREGAVTFYSNEPTEDNAAIVGAFARKYPIKVNLYRASSEEIRDRVVNEARARRFDVDFILDNAPAMEALSAEQLLQEVKSPYVADLMAAAVPRHRSWVGFCLNVLVAAYNTDLVRKADLPRSYQDLLDPKWKGRIGIEADDSDWFAGLIEQMGRERGLKLFRDIADANGFSVRKGHTLLTNLIAAGEVPLTLTVFNYTAEQFKKKGAPLDWFVLDPLISMPNSIALAANAPRPHAAILFFDFMLSDGQRILKDRDYVVTDRNIPSPLDRSRIHVMDSAKELAEGGDWQRLYTQIITSRN
jgi:ABC-type Fe3+ transport system substrate-binding protein